MRTPRVPLAALLIAAIAWAASGCANQNTQVPRSEQASSETLQPTEAPSATPASPTEPTPGASLSDAPTHSTLQAEFSDSDGYKYRVSVESPSITASSSLQNAKPGKAEVSAEISGTLTLENLTPGRDAPTHPVGLVPLWPVKSDLCRNAQAEVFGSMQYKPITADGQSEAKYCAGVGDGLYLDVLAGLDPLSPGGRIVIDRPDVQDVNGIQVPEQAADKCVSDAQTPVGWVLFGDDGLAGTQSTTNKFSTTSPQNDIWVELWRSEGLR